MEGTTDETRRRSQALSNVVQFKHATDGRKIKAEASPSQVHWELLRSGITPTRPRGGRWSPNILALHHSLHSLQLAGSRQVILPEPRSELQPDCENSNRSCVRLAARPPKLCVSMRQFPTTAATVNSRPDHRPISSGKSTMSSARFEKGELLAQHLDVVRQAARRWWRISCWHPICLLRAAIQERQQSVGFVGLVHTLHENGSA